MRYGSLFSGVGGFDLGLDRAGWECAWQVEIDSQCRDVLRYHWPNVPKHEDVTDVGESDLARVDLICGGFPCQDLSVAGRREGLAGERSGLFYEFMRIVGEIAPRWVLIENVPGLLSSNGGRDMGAVVGTLGELGYWWTYRVLDTQYFGPPQRRRRVFVVGHLGAPCPPEVLLEPASLPWNPPPSREAGEGPTPLLEVGARTSGDGYRDGDGIGKPGDPLYTLQARHQHGVVASETGRGWWTADGLARLRVSTAPGQPQNIVAPTLRVGGRDQGAGDGPDNTPITVTGQQTHALTAEGCDASEDGTGRGTPVVAFGWNKSASQTMRVGRESDALQASPTSNPAVLPPAMAFALRGRDGGATAEMGDDAAFALRSSQGGGDKPHVLAYGLDPQLNGDPEKVGALNTGGASGGGQPARVLQAAVPRRLTPRECERLQGFPDDWTRWGVDENGEPVEMADTPRYRMLGNAVSVPVAAWIGRRILEHHAAP